MDGSQKSQFWSSKNEKDVDQEIDEWIEEIQNYPTDKERNERTGRKSFIFISISSIDN